MDHKEIKPSMAELNDDQLAQANGGGTNTNMYYLPFNDVELIMETPELQDDQLVQVSGGAFGDPVNCPVCGKTMREGFACTACDMEDGSVMCHQCGTQITREQPCKICGKTWDAWVQETRWLRE